MGTQKQSMFREGVLTPGSFAPSAAPAATARTSATRKASFTARLCAAPETESRAGAKSLRLLRQQRMDLARELRDLLGQVLVLLRQGRVGLEQVDEPVRLPLHTFLEPRVALVRAVAQELVPVRLTGLGEQDQRRRVGSLGGEDQVQEDERPRIE